MPNNTTDPWLSAYIASLYAVSRQLSFYVALIHIIIGTIGNCLNILIFTSRNLRFNSCSFYFLCSSIANVPVIYVDMFTQMLTQYFSISTSVDFHVPYYFYVKTLSSGQLSCIGETSANSYRLISDIYFLLTYYLIPPSLMLLFGCLTKSKCSFVTTKSHNNKHKFHSIEYKK